MNSKEKQHDTTTKVTSKHEKLTLHEKTAMKKRQNYVEINH